MPQNSQASLWMSAVCALAIGCASSSQKRDDLPKMSKVVYGLVGSFDSESFVSPTPILEPYIAAGGVGFDTNARRAFIVSQNGLVRAVKDPELEELWRYEHNNPFTMAPRFLAKSAIETLPDDLVVVGTQGGEVIALNAKDGSLTWEYTIGGELRQAPIVHQRRLLITNSRNQLSALDPATGKWLWQYAREFPQGMTVFGHSGVTVDGDHAYVGFADGYVAAVRMEDGTALWARPLTMSSTGFADADATPEVFGNRVYAASFEDGVFALNKDTGESIWQLSMRGVTRLTVKEPRVFVANSSGELTALDAESGRTLWRFKFPPANVTKPLVYRGFVALGLSPGGLYVLEEDTGRPVQLFNPGGVVSELTLTAGELGFLSEGSVAYLMRYGERSAISLESHRRYLGF